jgi:hypothetical protein
LGTDPAFVSQNPRQRIRALWIDPRLQIGRNGQGLPYQQTIAGSVVTNASGAVIPPVNPRLIVFSSLGPAFPDAVVDGGTVAANFDALWNAAPETVPAGGPWSAWSGLGRDLRVQRVHLAPLFARLTLNNHASPSPGLYSIDGLGTNAVPNGTSGVNAYFIKGTRLELLTHTNTLDAQQILTRDCNFVYNLGVWRGAVFNPPPVTPPVMEYMAELFYRSPRNRNAAAGATPGTVLNAMEAFMAAYNAWAALGTWPTSSSDPAFRAVSDAQNALNQTLLDLMNDPTEGECD